MATMTRPAKASGRRRRCTAHFWYQTALSARVAVLPYSFDVPKASVDGLARACARYAVS